MLCPNDAPQGSVNSCIFSAKWSDILGIPARDRVICLSHSAVQLWLLTNGTRSEVLWFVAALTPIEQKEGDFDGSVFIHAITSEAILDFATLHKVLRRGRGVTAMEQQWVELDVKFTASTF